LVINSNEKNKEKCNVNFKCIKVGNFLEARKGEILKIKSRNEQIEQ
jgi:hypothetical protein